MHRSNHFFQHLAEVTLANNLHQNAVLVMHPSQSIHQHPEARTFEDGSVKHESDFVIEGERLSKGKKLLVSEVGNDFDGIGC
jgi:hypothetical protein